MRNSQLGFLASSKKTVGVEIGTVVEDGREEAGKGREAEGEGEGSRRWRHVEEMRRRRAA